MFESASNKTHLKAGQVIQKAFLKKAKAFRYIYKYKYEYTHCQEMFWEC